jgi:hypothetical protein
MSIRRAALIGALICCALLGAGLAQDSSSAKNDEPRNAFSGKALFVRLKNPGRTTVAVEDPAIQTFGESAFLIGRPAEGPVRAVRLWVPISDVQEIEEFSDTKEMGKWYKLSPALTRSRRGSSSPGAFFARRPCSQAPGC